MDGQHLLAVLRAAGVVDEALLKTILVGVARPPVSGGEAAVVQAPTDGDGSDAEADADMDLESVVGDTADPGPTAQEAEGLSREELYQALQAQQQRAEASSKQAKALKARVAADRARLASGKVRSPATKR